MSTGIWKRENGFFCTCSGDIAATLHSPSSGPWAVGPLSRASQKREFVRLVVTSMYSTMAGAVPHGSRLPTLRSMVELSPSTMTDGGEDPDATFGFSDVQPRLAPKFEGVSTTGQLLHSEIAALRTRFLGPAL